MLVKSKQPCDACGSSDAKAYYVDEKGIESTHCFSCGDNQREDNVSIGEQSKHVTEDCTPEEIATMLGTSLKGSYTKWSPAVFPKGEGYRGIKPEAFKRYGVLSDDKGRYGFPYHKGLKVRETERKHFSFVHGGGVVASGVLFGQHLFPKGGKFLTITEGEWDALSMYQAFGADYAVVSIPNGAPSALKDCQAAYDYIDSFDKVVLCFDADEPGQKAAQQVANLFPGKAAVMKMDGELKDANGYLQANKSAALVKAWWAAEVPRPAGITSFSELKDLVLSPAVEPLITFPYEKLNQMTDGVRAGEVVVLAAGTGLGKSSFAREWVDHILQTTEGIKVGMMMLEESPMTTAKRQVSVRLGIPIHRLGHAAAPELVERAFANLAQGNRLEIYSQLKVRTPAEMLQTLTFMIKALGCEVIILDHISIIVSGSESDNERKDIDVFMTNLRALTEATGCVIIAISHLTKQSGGTSHEEGGRVMLSHLRGSGSIAQLADVVLVLERATQSDKAEERETTQIRLLKNRWTGDVGPACQTVYDKQTGLSRLVPSKLKGPTPTPKRKAL